MPAQFPELNVAIVSGTFSSGKTTLINGLQQGRLSDIEVFDQEYDDFGYGILQTESSQRPLVIVPEAARWYATAMNRLDFLTTNYSVDVQNTIDSQNVFRCFAAIDLAKTVTERLVDSGKLHKIDKPVGRPLVIQDSGPIEGVIYSTLRCPDDEINQPGASIRNGFTAEWMRSFVDIAFIADHHDILLQLDGARLDDEILRDKVAHKITANYRHFFGANVVTLSGSQEQRLETVRTMAGYLPPLVQRAEYLPYTAWTTFSVQ